MVRVWKDNEETEKTGIWTWFGPSRVFVLQKEWKDQVHHELQKQSNLYVYEGQYGKHSLAKFPSEVLHS